MRQLRIVAVAFASFVVLRSTADCGSGTGGDWGDYNITAIATSASNVTFTFSAQQYIGGNEIGWEVDTNSAELRVGATPLLAKSRALFYAGECSVPGSRPNSWLVLPCPFMGRRPFCALFQTRGRTPRWLNTTVMLENRCEDGGPFIYAAADPVGNVHPAGGGNRSQLSFSGICDHCGTCSDASGPLRCQGCPAVNITIHTLPGANSTSVAWDGDKLALPGHWTEPSHFSGHVGVPGATEDLYIEMDVLLAWQTPSARGVMTRNSMDPGAGYFYHNNCSFSLVEERR